MTTMQTPRVSAAAPSRRCTCGVPVRDVTIMSGTLRGTVVPIDLGPVEAGMFAAQPDVDGQWGVRLVSASDGGGGHRYGPHWATCRLAGQYRLLAELVALGTLPNGAGVSGRDRVGFCATCGGHNPHRYGGPRSSPLCDACRVERGFDPIDTVEVLL